LEREGLELSGRSRNVEPLTPILLCKEDHQNEWELI
jgi:hypothetical protein